MRYRALLVAKARGVIAHTVFLRIRRAWPWYPCAGFARNPPESISICMKSRSDTASVGVDTVRLYKMRGIGSVGAVSVRDFRRPHAFPA